MIKIEGNVIERSSVNKNMLTGEIEIDVNKAIVLNKSKTPPFIIEDETDVLNINDYLSNNDSYTFLDKINSLYITGPSGTNVADIQITLINNS